LWKGLLRLNTTREDGNITDSTERECINLEMVVFTKASGEKIKKKAGAFIIMLMEIRMRDNSSGGLNMERAFINIRLAIIMRESISLTLNTEMAGLSLQMGINMTEGGREMSSMVRDVTYSIREKR
jgi:hypothetical protein